MTLVRDTWLQYQRALMLTLRNPVWVFVGLAQPMLFLLLFAPLLKSLAGPGLSPDDAFNLFVPGLLIQIAMFGTAFAGFGLIEELREGVIERMRVTPTGRFSLLIGRALRDVTILVAQGVLLVALAIPFGLRLDLAGVAVAFVLIALLGLLTASFSYAMALKLRSEDALAPLIQMITIPLLLLSGILLPLTLAPDWLRTIASFNPFSHAVDAARALFNGHFADPSVLPGVGMMVILAIVVVWLAGRTFDRAIA